MKLSIIIINQSFCRSLRHSLASLTRAAQNIEHEIIVIDNASRDKSVHMVKTEYPQVNLIALDKQQGFSKVANQAIGLAQGEYLLFADPHIIAGEDTLEKSLAFFESHVHSGALTVRMLDAEGHFIPESKNGIPAAWAKFFKYTGLTRLFPKSRLFSHRHQPGWDEEFETAEMDIICSNFMLISKAVLNKVGLFDERFAVYGMDIDFSYRIRLAGFTNYYYAKTFVILQHVQHVHKYSWRFIKNFYGAMFIFATKYLFQMPELRIKGVGGWSAPKYEFER